MNTLLYRYNRFTRSYLVNYHNYEFEVEPELFTIIQTYYTTNDISNTMQEAHNHNIELSENDLLDIINMIESGKANYNPFLQVRTYKILDLKVFNKLLDHSTLMWLIIISLLLFSIFNIHLFFHYLLLSRRNFYLFSNIILIIPLYFFSRVLFTPVHEFGHNFFYYLFTGNSSSFYIQFPGFMYFAGITTTDNLFYIKNPLKRIIISLGGMLFESMFLIILLHIFQNLINPFFLQILTMRVFLSVLFNLNFLSQSTDGHILVTDLLGFTTFTETYNDFLKYLLNKKYIPSVPVNKRVKLLLLIYTVIGVIFIGIFVLSQLYFLIEIIHIMLLPLTNSFNGVHLGIVGILLLLISYLYYIDILVRLYRKKVVIQKIIAFRE